MITINSPPIPSSAVDFKIKVEANLQRYAVNIDRLPKPSDENASSSLAGQTTGRSERVSSLGHQRVQMWRTQLNDLLALAYPCVMDRGGLNFMNVASF